MPENEAKETTPIAEPEEKAAASDSGNKEEFEKIDADKIVKPYIDRITKEQAKKNDYKNKYKEALKELDQLKKNGGKSVKDITEKEAEKVNVIEIAKELMEDKEFTNFLKRVAIPEQKK